MVTTQVKKSVNGSAGNIKLVKDAKKPVSTVKAIKPKTTAPRSSAVKEVEKKSEKIIATVNRSKLAAPQRKSVKIPPVVASSEKSRKLSQVPFLDKEKFKKHTRIIRAAVQMSSQGLPPDDASMNKLLFKTKRGKLYNDEMMTQ